MAEPSVALNTPATMPPITTTIKEREGRACRVALPRVAQLNLPGVPLYPFFFARIMATAMQHRAQITPGK